MKKLLVLALALILALGCVSALAEEELPESLDIRVLVWTPTEAPSAPPWKSGPRTTLRKWASTSS